MLADRDQIEAENRGAATILIKEFCAQKARMYYKKNSEMYIPTTLWE